MAATIVLIPADEGRPLSEVAVDGPLGRDVVSYLRSLACRDASGTVSVDATSLIRPAPSAPGGEKGGEEEGEGAGGARSDGDGLLAYSVSTAAGGAAEEELESRPNVRATRLAMACGRHGLRLRGDVWAARLGGEAREGGAPPTLLDNVGCRAGDVGDACLLSPDLRGGVLGRLRREDGGSAMATAGLGSESASGANEDDGGSRAARRWLGDAAMRAYRDGGSIAALAKAMSRAEEPGGTSSEDDEGGDDEASTSSSSDSSSSGGGEDSDSAAAAAEAAGSSLVGRTLCIHCRGPADALCAGCGGVYLHPRCAVAGWSHACLCRTWRVYVDRRASLSEFTSCFSGWQEPLLTEENFASEAPYRDFLKGLGVLGADTWWSTELDGWSGGDGDGARRVDPARRRNYADGFGLGPGSAELIPPERRATRDDLARAGLDADGFGLPVLNSWSDYYALRRLPPESPAALLLTFPLTAYRAIQVHGQVPLTVASMLGRPLRVHAVGIEKELNFVDAFGELGRLMPPEVRVEMSWVVRGDMLPAGRRGERGATTSTTRIEITTNLAVTLVCGTYGSPSSLDPDFDVPGGPPDMILGMNAGLYAYESWRHVVDYLHGHPNVVGCFTDYNEHSGVNCAKLGGWRAAQSLEVNPFRQPRAMPVYCMNLPQFSNGFMYVFNEQDLE